MNVVIWARVSSREQREGYSIDAQLRFCRERATREGWTVAREFVVAESAKRGAERLAFNEMYKWVRSNARKLSINAILAHKLDRVCRNIRDAVRLQELEDTCGVKLSFVDNQFGPGAAGALSFNVMAAVAQYYSDNLRTEVLKGIDEKVRQGWPAGLAPFGYMNVPDKEQPIQVHPERSKAVLRIFELYSAGDMTFEKLTEQLAAEGYVYRPSQPQFSRTTLSYILNNRMYIGEIVWRGKVYHGKFQPLVSRNLFEECQAILQGKNRRLSTPNHYLAGGLFRCSHCGQGLTGERIKKVLSDGTVKYFTYYRCANNHPGPEHPRVRWREEKLEQAVIDELAKLQIGDPEVRAWFRKSLETAFADLTRLAKSKRDWLLKRRSELKGMQDRLLTAFLGGSIDEAAFNAKQVALKCEAAEVEKNLEEQAEMDPAAGRAALTVFDFMQEAATRWAGSKPPERRAILESVCLNRQANDVSLELTKRKPFDLFVEGSLCQSSRGDWI